MEYIIIATTFEKEDEAKKMANGLLGKKLVACCQIEKINTFYWWKGKIENCFEYKLSSKTVAIEYKEVEAYIKKNHSYEIPEIVSMPLVNGLPQYFDWLKEQTK